MPVSQVSAITDLENLHGAWKEIKQGFALPGDEAFTTAFGIIDGRPVPPTLAVNIKRVPQARLRLVVRVSRERVGQEMLLIRAKWLLSARTRRFALMPFDTKFCQDAEIISKEFTLQ